MDKPLQYLALARKAGIIELGEEPVGAITRSGRAALVIVAADASDHTWRRAQSFVAGTNQICLRISYTKDQLGMSIGRTSLAIAAIKDPAMALAFVTALEQPDKHRTVLQALERRTQRVQQRRKEEKAHLKNKQIGKRRRDPVAKKDN